MKPKILIVDDEPLNLRTFKTIFANEGYDLHLTSSAEEACALADAIRPDLILLDLMMPNVDGYEVCRRIRNDPAIGRIPIIIVTALDDETARLQALRVGAEHFISKPFRREELLLRVRTVATLNRFRTMSDQRERFERLYELAPVAIILTDQLGRVQSANSYATATLATPDGRPLVDELIFSRFDAGSADTLGATLATAWRSETAPVREVRTASDPPRILQVRAHVVPDSGGRVVMLLFNDVSETVRAREAVEVMNADLEAKVHARTAELEEANALLLSYASYVSHDLNAPLTVMQGSLDLLREGIVPLDASAAPLIAQTHQAAVLMQETLNNILQLARDEHAGRSHAPRELLEPAPLIRRVSLHFAALYPHLHPRFVIADLPAVAASAVVIERVFYQLLDNALKFSRDEPTPEIEVGWRADPGGPVLFVRDHGIGFEPCDADKLFQEFSRLPNAHRHRGSGLGLSLLARLVQLHHGRIWAEGAPGKGATFFVQFPTPAATPIAAAAGPGGP